MRNDHLVSPGTIGNHSRVVVYLTVWDELEHTCGVCKIIRTKDLFSMTLSEGRTSNKREDWVNDELFWEQK